MSNIESFLVSNALVDRRALEQLPLSAKIQVGRRPVVVPIFQIHFGQKRFLAGLAGGKLNKNSDMGVDFTLIGFLVADTLSRLPGGDRTILRYLNCDCSDEEMKRKLREIFEFAKEGDHILLIGDHAGRCDGKIIKHLNLRAGGITLPLDGVQ